MVSALRLMGSAPRADFRNEINGAQTGCKSLRAYQNPRNAMILLDFPALRGNNQPTITSMGYGRQCPMAGYEKHFQMMWEPCQLYRHYAADGALLYVGIARNARRRKYQHKCGAEWASLIAKTTVHDYETREDAASAEALAITFERPAYNAKRPTPRGVPPSIRSAPCPVLQAFFALPPRQAAPRKPIARRAASDVPEDWYQDMIDTWRNFSFDAATQGNL